MKVLYVYLDYVGIIADYKLNVNNSFTYGWTVHSWIRLGFGFMF